MGWSSAGPGASDAFGVRDVNGRPVRQSRWQTLAARISGAREVRTLALDEDLPVVVACTDDAASSSALLESSSWRPDDQVVVRHVLVLPTDRVAEATGLAALDRYQVLDPTVLDDAAISDPGISDPGISDPALPAGHGLVVLARVQLLDALHLSQERSRMASLGSRHGGRVVGWQILQRPSP